MKSHYRKLLSLAVALSMLHIAVLGHNTQRHETRLSAQSHSEVEYVEEIVGSQGIDWVVCAVAGIGSVFFPLMNLVAGPACFSAVVRTWG